MQALVAAFRSLGPGRILALLLGVAAVIGIAGYTLQNLNKPGMVLLYGGLNASETSRIVSVLQTNGTAYELRGDSSVYVPQDQVGQLRLMVAGQGLVGAGAGGYELFDNQSAFGTTNFVQNLNAKRALEGELAKTIMSLPAVTGARVHLVLPRQNLFSREQTTPTAAVALNLADRTLDSGQVNSIAQLVAAAVPNLKLENVTIIDQRGGLLFDGQTQSKMAGTQRENEVEKSYEATLTSLLERVVGVGKAAVRVTAELNPEEISENQEIYDPAQQVVRSEQTIESSSNSAGGGSGGVTGVAGNTPGDTVGGTGGSGSNAAENRTETTTNYEIGKTLRTRKVEGGQVKKLSVAVLVEGKTAENEKGEKTYTPLTDAEKTNLRTLVQTAIGFNADRGDKVDIVDMEFSTPPEPPAVKEPLVNTAQLMQLGQTGALIAALLVVAFLIIRPAMGVLSKALGTSLQVTVNQGGGARVSVNSVGGGEAAPSVDMQKVEGRIRESALKRANEIVDQAPEESLAVIRSWMADAPGATRDNG